MQGVPESDEQGERQMTDSQPARGCDLPCPFCGSSAVLMDSAVGRMFCMACLAQGPRDVPWNTRVAGGGGEVVTDEAVEHAMEVLIENLDENRHGDVRLGEMYVEEADAYTVAYEIRGAWTVGALGDAMRAALVAALQVKP